VCANVDDLAGRGGVVGAEMDVHQQFSKLFAANDIVSTVSTIKETIRVIAPIW